jgi:hypothetical protein
MKQRKFGVRANHVRTMQVIDEWQIVESDMANRGKPSLETTRPHPSCAQMAPASHSGDVCPT